MTPCMRVAGLQAPGWPGRARWPLRCRRAGAGRAARSLARTASVASARPNCATASAPAGALSTASTAGGRDGASTAGGRDAASTAGGRVGASTAGARGGASTEGARGAASTGGGVVLLCRRWAGAAVLSLGVAGAGNDVCGFPLGVGRGRDAALVMSLQRGCSSGGPRGEYGSGGSNGLARRRPARPGAPRPHRNCRRCGYQIVQAFRTEDLSVLPVQCRADCVGKVALQKWLAQQVLPLVRRIAVGWRIGGKASGEQA